MALAATLELLVTARLVWKVRQVALAAAMAAPVALAALAEREPIAVLVALAAVALPDRAALVVLVLRASAALEAVAALVALAGMRAVSPTAQLVVMPAQVAPAAWVEPLARRARTPRP